MKRERKYLGDEEIFFVIFDRKRVTISNNLICAGFVENFALGWGFFVFLADRLDFFENHHFLVANRHRFTFAAHRRWLLGFDFFVLA